MDRPTAQEVIENVGLELALATESELAAPYGSTNQNIVLLCRLLTRVGRLLVRARDWSHLETYGTIATGDDTEQTPLPDDFVRIVPGTVWHPTTKRQLASVDAQTYQALSIAGSATGASLVYRIQLGQMYILPIPDDDFGAVTFKYISRYWVSTGAPPTATSLSEPTASTHYLWFDEPLMTAGLKLAFLRAKGMDTAAAQQDFKTAWDGATGGDGGAPAAILLSGGGGFRLLDTRNLPDTGWGL